jgi:hypothetical protein
MSSFNGQVSKASILSSDDAKPGPTLSQAVIDVLAEATAQYPADDKLTLWNRRFTERYEPIQLRVGMSFDEVLQAMAPRSQ